MRIWKQDILVEAQRVMNANQELSNKNLISAMTNEIVALRAEIDSLESKPRSDSRIQNVSVVFDPNGEVSGVKVNWYE